MTLEDRKTYILLVGSLQGHLVGNASGDPVGGAVVKTRRSHPVRFLVKKRSPQSLKQLGRGFLDTQSDWLCGILVWPSPAVLVFQWTPKTLASRELELNGEQ